MCAIVRRNEGVKPVTFSQVEVNAFNNLSSILYDVLPVRSPSSHKELLGLLTPEAQQYIAKNISTEERTKVAIASELVIDAWRRIEPDFLTITKIDRAIFIKSISESISTGSISDTLIPIVEHCKGVVWNVEWANIFAWQLPVVKPESAESFFEIAQMIGGIFYLERYAKLQSTKPEALASERVTTLLKLVVNLFDSNEKVKNKVADEIFGTTAPSWAEKILFKTIVKIETLNVFDLTEGNDYPHHQVSANCKVLIGADCVSGDIYFAVEPHQAKMLGELKTLLQPEAILWITAKDINFSPEEEQILRFNNPEIEVVTGIDLDDLLISRFESPQKTEFVIKQEANMTEIVKKIGQIIETVARKEDFELTQISGDKGIFYMPELAFVYHCGKAIMKNKEDVFGTIEVKWKREENIGSGGPTDLLFELPNKKHIAIEFKLRDKANAYLSDIEKLLRLDKDNCVCAFCALVDAFTSKLPLDSRISSVDERSDVYSLLEPKPHFPTKQNWYKSEVSCVVGFWGVGDNFKSENKVTNN